MAKKSANEPSKKTENKEKAKIIEDKTFGLKNKNKSAKVNKYVQQVTQQVQSGGSRKAQKEEEARLAMKKAKKEEEERLKKEQALLGKAIIVQPKVPFGNPSAHPIFSDLQLCLQLYIKSAAYFNGL
jgi:biopolymer transport protein ExbB/TolQ